MRLTASGKLLLGSALLLVVPGVLLRLSPMVVVGVCLLALVGVATTIVAEAPQVTLDRDASPMEVPRGQASRVRLLLSSTSRKRPRPITLIETVAGEQRVAVIPPIPTGQSREVTYELNTSKRGLITAGPLLARRMDPFGLVVADKPIGGTVSVSVRPRLRTIRLLPSGRQRDLEGPTRERSEGTATFHQLREYVSGDDMRRIHWPSTARYGNLLVKHLVDTTRPEIVVILDNRATVITEDDFEEAVEITAALVAAAEREGFPVLLLFSDGDNSVGLDGKQAPHLDRLTAVQRSEVDSLRNLSKALQARGRSMILITGELPGRDLPVVTTLMHGFAPTYLVSIVRDRHTPLVAPPGTRAIASSNGDEFVVHWATLR